MILEARSINILKEKLHNWSFSFLSPFLLLGVMAIASCGDRTSVTYPQNKRAISGEAQGTTYNIVYFTEEIRMEKHRVDSLLDEIDLAASVWVDSSVISRFNQSTENPFELTKTTNAYFLDNFFLCKEVYKNTNGAYNPTVGALVNAWGFGFKNKENMDSSKVDTLLRSVGFADNQLQLIIPNAGNPFITKSNPNTQLDYNGIAQGYSVDVLAEFFKNNGIDNFMIEIGGELIANGRKSDGSFWKIGIDKPTDGNLGRQLAATIKLDSMAVATSGNYRKFYEKDGVKYAHTIDPFTGFPVQHSLLSVTVAMANCGLADAYATSFMVMGYEKAKALIASKPELGIEAYFIYNDEDGNYQTYFTPGLEKSLSELE